MLPLKKRDNFEEETKIQWSPFRIFVFLYFAVVAIGAAFGTWNLAYSFTNKDPSQFPNLLSEKCFATFFMLFGYLWEVPEKYINDADNKAEVFKLFEDFSYQRTMRKELYFIDPFTFLVVVLIIGTVIEFYNICCYKLVKKTFFTFCLSYCYDIFFFTFSLLFVFEAYNFLSTTDHRGFLDECLKKVSKH